VLVAQVVLVSAVQEVQAATIPFFQLLLLLVAVVVVLIVLVVVLVYLVGRVVVVTTERVVVTLLAVLERQIKDLGEVMEAREMVLVVVEVLAHRE
jgi:hypothetical protein